jgi:hypothetical protein
LNEKVDYYRKMVAKENSASITDTQRERVIKESKYTNNSRRSSDEFSRLPSNRAGILKNSISKSRLASNRQSGQKEKEVTIV